MIRVTSGTLHFGAKSIKETQCSVLLRCKLHPDVWKFIQ